MIRVLSTGYSKPLLTPLSAEEHIACARMLTEKMSDYDNELTSQEGLKKQMKSRLADLETEIRVLRLAVNRGAEMRDVACELQANDELGVAIEIRCDTGVAINDRTLLAEERQVPLPLDGPTAIDLLEDTTNLTGDETVGEEVTEPEPA